MDGFTIALVIALLLAGIGYALPAFIALDKNHPQQYWIVFCNIFFGATGVGWLICLIWALSYKSLEKKQ